MADENYVLQPLEEIVSKQLWPVGPSEHFKEKKLSRRENLKHYALLTVAIAYAGWKLYGLIVSNHDAFLRMCEDVQTAIEFFK